VFWVLGPVTVVCSTADKVFSLSLLPTIERGQFFLTLLYVTAEYLHIGMSGSLVKKPTGSTLM